MQEHQQRPASDSDRTVGIIRESDESEVDDYDADETDADAERFLDPDDVVAGLPDHLDAPFEAPIPDVIDQRREVPYDEVDGPQ